MVNIQKIEMSPKDLDAQSVIQVDEWVDLGSQKHRDTDEWYVLSTSLLEKSSENGFLKIDSLGRLWVHGIDQEFLPYHYDSKAGNQFLGLRIATAAAN